MIKFRFKPGAKSKVKEEKKEEKSRYYKKIAEAPSKYSDPTAEFLIKESLLPDREYKVFQVMKDRKEHTLKEVSDLTGVPESSVSSSYRILSKMLKGIYRYERVKSATGVYKYQFIRIVEKKEVELPTFNVGDKCPSCESKIVSGDFDTIECSKCDHIFSF
jgi:hypothetical protein